MTQLHDERLDVLAAIDEATSPHDRRRASRIKRKVATQMTPWSVGVAAVPIGIVIEDISESGVAVVHSEPLPEGSKFLVTVPRKYHGPQVVECDVVRCEPRGGRLFTIGMRATQRIEHIEHAKAEMTLTSRRTRLLFLTFGIISLCVAMFMPL
jgi:hypothetical protein